jgi:hypothetical protein
MIGMFDAELRHEAWFDPELVPEGWFDEDFIAIPAGGGGFLVRTTAEAIAVSDALVRVLIIQRAVS